MKNGIYTVKEYNNQMTAKYSEDCKNWDAQKGGFPQIVFYLFEQKTGFIKVSEQSNHWYKTKKEILL